MDQNAKHNAHCVYVTPALACGASVTDPLVWIPRDRKQVLLEPMAPRLKPLFREIATQYGFEIMADQVMPDPVHWFGSAPPKFAPAQGVRWFRGLPARRLTQEFQHIRRAYRGPNAT